MPRTRADGASDAFYWFRIRKARVFGLGALLLVVVVVTAVGEVLVRFTNAQPYMIPRYQFSALYGHELPRSTVMVNRRPGDWTFRYTINEFGYRGPAIPISNRYERANVVVLGDSYSMGIGVSDGEEYPAVLSRILGDCTDVVNLGVGGYGLTHEIRRFYEFGILYRPEVVILQFFHNDPADDVEDHITRVEEGRFRFRSTRHSTGLLKQALSDSVIQYSQVYNLLRNFAYRAVRGRRLAAAEATVVDEFASGPLDPKEALYLSLLSTFAKDLAGRQIELVVIAVNGSLDRHAGIREGVRALDRAGHLRYVDVVPWFEDVENYGSPEGHGWGAKAHRIVGEQLARILDPDLLPFGPDGVSSACAAADAASLEETTHDEAPQPVMPTS